MTGRRHWGLVAWLLRQAISAAHAKGHPLTERVSLPEPFRLEQKGELVARRLTVWQQAAARPRRVQQLMILIAEVKAIAPARYGHKLVLKHLADAPLFLDEGRHRRLTHRFRPRDRHVARRRERPPQRIATCTVGRGGSAAAEEVALMPTTAQWLPCRDPYAQILLDTLVKQRRRFRTTLRFLLAPEVDLPVAVLTDCHTPHGFPCPPRRPGSSRADRTRGRSLGLGCRRTATALAAARAIPPPGGVIPSPRPARADIHSAFGGLARVWSICSTTAQRAGNCAARSSRRVHD